MVQMKERRTAYHEAAHAVVARVLGLTCGEVSIVKSFEDGTAGHAIIEDPSVILKHWGAQGFRLDAKRVMRRRIMAVMAGREIEILHYGFCLGGDTDDQRQIAMMANSANFDAETLAIFKKATVALCRKYQPIIDALALDLQKRERIEGYEVDAFVKGRKAELFRGPQA